MNQPGTTNRATAPVVGVALLVALTVLAATAVGTATVALDTPAQPSMASFSLTVDPTRDTLTLRHRGGDTLDTDGLRLRVTVAGKRLAHQPPVPFFAATGYRSGPTGPLNSEADSIWSAGERATLRLATTNAPLPETGDRVTVAVFSDRTPVATVHTTAA